MNKAGLPLMRPLAKALFCVALLGSLSGCVGLVLGGAVAGAAAGIDRRTLGAQTDDKAISIFDYGEDVHINANSYNRMVLLTGEVKDEAMKAAVEREVKAIDGVVSVANELVIGGPSSYTQRSSDALITTKVKASLIDMKTISATSFKVVTERGVVYLLGRVTEREAQVGSDVARGVSGVNKVVMVNFWATDCSTCVKEMPQMVETYNKFKAQGLEFVAVAMKYDPPNYVINFTETRKLPFVVALDSGGDIARSFGQVTLTPTTFVIDKHGRIIKRYVGEPDFAALHLLLEKALKS